MEINLRKHSLTLAVAAQLALGVELVLFNKRADHGGMRTVVLAPMLATGLHGSAEALGMLSQAPMSALKIYKDM